MRPKFFNSQLKFYSPTKSQKRINKSTRFISSEIEIASIKTNKKLVEDVIKKWDGSIVYDGTLSKMTGFEINTSPAAGDMYVRQVTNICNALKKASAKIDNACGLHVHIDARDFNFCDIARLIKVYSLIEPTLFAMVPNNRRNSEYSIKCGDRLDKPVNLTKLSYIDLKEKLITAVYGVPDSISYRTSKRGAGEGTGRYYALNLHSWFFRGTVECRLFDGSLNKDDIINWGMLWARILDFVLFAKDSDISTMNGLDSYANILNIIGKNARLKSFIDARCIMHEINKAG